VPAGCHVWTIRVGGPVSRSSRDGSRVRGLAPCVVAERSGIGGRGVAGSAWRRMRGITAMSRRHSWWSRHSSIPATPSCTEPGRSGNHFQGDRGLGRSTKARVGAVCVLTCVCDCKEIRRFGFARVWQPAGTWCVWLHSLACLLLCDTWGAALAGNCCAEADKITNGCPRQILLHPACCSARRRSPPVAS
jgi:hypothetical protein